MNKVFISYRRQDSQAHAGRLSDLLLTELPNSVVFMDVDGISPGEDFVEKISEQLSACSVFLPVIGPRWLHVRRGLRRRLFLPNDFVRLEVLAAIHRPIAEDNHVTVYIELFGLVLLGRRWHKEHAKSKHAK